MLDVSLKVIYITHQLFTFHITLITGEPYEKNIIDHHPVNTFAIQPCV